MEECKMKKLASVMVIFGVILLSGIGFVYYTEGAVAFSMKSITLEESHVISAKKIAELNINTLSTDVELLPHNKEDIIVELNGQVSEKMKDAYQLTVEENDDVLNVKLDRKSKPSFSVFAINKGVTLTVLIPEKKYDEIVIESKSGDVNVEDLTADHMLFKAASGDMVVENLSARDITIQTTSGDTFANGISADVLNMEAVSGDMTGEKLTAVSEMTLQAKSGDIILNTTVEAYTLDFEGTSGDGIVKVPGFLYKEKEEDRINGTFGDDATDEGILIIKVRTTSGDFTLE
jgi:lia operon protein LiaG